MTEVPLSRASDLGPGLFSLLFALNSKTLARLYASPASCLAVFRLLPLVARHLVLNMIWYDLPFPRSHVALWAGKHPVESKRHLDASLNKLFRLRLVQERLEQPGNGGAAGLILDPTFKESLRQALTGGGSHGSFGVPCRNSHRDVQELDRYGTEKWEVILHYMVGSRLRTQPGLNVLALLDRSGLMASVDPGYAQGMKITSKGFQFLLESVNTQRWDILLQYLKLAETNGVDVVDVLSCLFMLASLELGQEYSFAHWTSTQVQVLKDLVDYGLVLLSGSNRFYPTRLATTLTSSAPPLVTAGDASQEEGFIVLETNYRVYAYTSNPLQIAVLNLFITFRHRFANMVVGAVTRDSIKSALSNGITADQIIMYLKVHAHPQMRKVNPLLPPTVVDQVRLWELEKNRVHHDEGYLYEDFRSCADYDLVAQYSRQLGVVLWENSETRVLFVSAEGHSALREFIKRRMGGAE